jgi:hypothetical protein
MKVPKDQMIEFVPKGEELASKMSMLGCGIQMLVAALVWMGFLTLLVFIALLA